MRGSQGGGNQQRSGFSTFYSAPPARPAAETRVQNGTQEGDLPGAGRRTQDWRLRRRLAMRLHRRLRVASKVSRSSSRATPAMRPWTTASTATTQLIVLATLHSCENQNPQLKAGGKLIGRVEKTQQQVRVAFNKMTLPGRRGRERANRRDRGSRKDEARSRRRRRCGPPTICRATHPLASHRCSPATDVLLRSRPGPLSSQRAQPSSRRRRSIRRGAI